MRTSVASSNTTLGLPTMFACGGSPPSGFRLGRRSVVLLGDVRKLSLREHSPFSPLSEEETKHRVEGPAEALVRGVAARPKRCTTHIHNTRVQNVALGPWECTGWRVNFSVAAYHLGVRLIASSTLGPALPTPVLAAKAETVLSRLKVHCFCTCRSTRISFSLCA